MAYGIPSHEPDSLPPFGIGNPVRPLQACIGYAPYGSTLGTPNWGSEIPLYDLITAKIDMYLNRIFGPHIVIIAVINS